MLTIRMCCQLVLAIFYALMAAATVADEPKPFVAEAKWSTASDWGPGPDASPAFRPNGKTVYFTHPDGEKRTIMVSHLNNGVWSTPKAAEFSGTWRDIEPAMAPDGSYLIFVSNRPITEGGAVLDGYFGGAVRPGKGGNLWHVKRKGSGWTKPVRLPNVVNSSSAIYSPAVSRNGNLYFAQPDPKTRKTRLYRSQFNGGKYELPAPLSFSDGVTSDYDPVVAPDESFIIFSSVRSPTPHNESGIFVAFSDNDRWKTPIAFKPFLIGIEARLSPDLKTLYFTSDRLNPETSTAAQTSSVNSASPKAETIWQIPLSIRTMMTRN